MNLPNACALMEILVKRLEGELMGVMFPRKPNQVAWIDLNR